MLNGTLKDNEICHNCGEAVRPWPRLIATPPETDRTKPTFANRFVADRVIAFGTARSVKSGSQQTLPFQRKRRQPYVSLLWLVAFPLRSGCLSLLAHPPSSVPDLALSVLWHQYAEI